MLGDATGPSAYFAGEHEAAYLKPHAKVQELFWVLEYAEIIRAAKREDMLASPEPAERAANAASDEWRDT